MKYLVNDPASVEFLDDVQLPATSKVLLGDPDKVDPVVRPEFLSAQMELRHAAGKVAALVNDPTRTDVQKHAAAKKLADAALAKLERAKGVIEQRANQLESDALQKADLALGPRADRGMLESDVRDWLWDVAKKPGGLEKIKKAMVESEDLCRVVWHSPRFLMNMSEESVERLRFEALNLRQPELYANLATAMHLHSVAGKFDKAIRKARNAFYNPVVANAAGRRVEV